MDNEELKAENARLKAEAERYRLASLRVDVGELHSQFNKALFDETVAENARLKAEVERLTKAVMHSPAAQLKLKELEGKNTYEEINPKEGKQSNG